MPKWNGLYVLKMSPDNIIHQSAEEYREWYRLGDDHRLTSVTGGVENKGWKNVQADEPLKALTFRDKLMIVAHADANTVGGKEPHVLAKWLKEICGLNEVGLITFKSCSVGRGDFLGAFVSACVENEIKVGWLKGYRGPASTRLDAKTKKPTEIVVHESSSGQKKGEKRLKIIKGTHNVNVEGSRFLTDVDDHSEVIVR